MSARSWGRLARRFSAIKSGMDAIRDGRRIERDDLSASKEAVELDRMLDEQVYLAMGCAGSQSEKTRMPLSRIQDSRTAVLANARGVDRWSGSEAEPDERLDRLARLDRR